MKSWNISGDGCSWSVELVVRDLGGDVGGHLDFTRRARAVLMGLRRLVRCLWGFSPS